MSSTNSNLIGITERGDAALDLSWEEWVFNQKRPAILISKDPAKLYAEVERLTQAYGYSPNIIVHCTITGLGCSKIEPGVPAVENSLKGYSDFVSKFGSERVVLRCDPIIPVEKFVVHASKNVMDKSIGTRIRFSFLDMYGHVKQRFLNAGIDSSKLGFTDGNLHVPLEERLRLVDIIKSSIHDPEKLEACGEPGINSAPCVSKKDCDILGVHYMDPSFSQRFACHCAANKTELLGMKGRCKHGCLYCYWKDQKDYFSGK